jgi:hypothetical protein
MERVEIIEIVEHDPNGARGVQFAGPIADVDRIEPDQFVALEATTQLSNPGQQIIVIVRHARPPEAAHGVSRDKLMALY